MGEASELSHEKVTSLTNANAKLSKVIFFYVCGVCILIIYFISITILCVSQERLRLVESNQQIYDFYMCVILKRKLFKASYSFSAARVAAVCT